MLHKLFGTKDRSKPSLDNHCMAAERSSALKIIHAGGRTDYYYMAIPASRVMEMYPSFILAKPEIFRRPWDSVVRPEEMLVPGQKFFVVPIRTVKKLKRRIRKPVKDSFLDLFVSECSKDELSSKSYLPKRDVSSKPKGKIKVEKRLVSFNNIDKKKAGGNDIGKKRDGGGLKKSSSGDTSSEIKTRRVKMITWEPSLTVIAECHVE
ncbi:Myeloid-associated differentiation marker-like protein [Heracleum sosnowskyi]|uniref:Myeloid-associated differentiation marker-like protein n=1 Tax=Heracleum sosnowskyi TaxID=360622 RepID=A0AAD8ISE1_9APIA|nr:Myeloid-associated differentiation marker-like protein [Heracleum sosnowskyi]